MTILVTIPERFLCAGRSPKQEFDPEEALYLRYSSEHFKGESLPTMAVKAPAFSVNRQLFSRPSDVLIPNWLNFGIAEFKVKDIPNGLIPDISFKPVHDPIDRNHPDFNHMGFENYAHTEVRMFKGSNDLGKNKIPDSLKKKFRTYFRSKLKLNITLESLP